MDDFLKKSIQWTLLISLAVAVVVALKGSLLWAGGFLFAACWATADFLLTINLLKIAILQYPKKKMRLLLLVKFPLLYLSLLLVLVYHIFPISSILIGLLPILIVAGVFKLCQRHTVPS